MNINKAELLFKQIHTQLITQYSFLENWRVQFDNARKRAGACKIDEKVITIGTLHVVNNTEEVVLDTVYHEFSHAIAFYLYGDKGHGKNWKAIATKLGAVAKSRGKYNLPEAPWVLVVSCSIQEKLERIAPRYRRNKNIKKYSLKGRPNTHGNLFYIKSSELASYESGLIGFKQLNLIQ